MKRTEEGIKMTGRLAEENREYRRRDDEEKRRGKKGERGR